MTGNRTKFMFIGTIQFVSWQLILGFILYLTKSKCDREMRVFTQGPECN